MRISAKIASVLVLAGMMAAGPASAASSASSVCKGLDQTGCGAQTGCSWVKAHKTTKGKDVAAFCRKKPERSKANEAAAAAPKG
jgi:hypothetical protein